jgi:two-component system sensor histidine kinase QseC
MSLRKYLLISILLIITTLGGMTVLSSYQASRHEVQELFDAQLSRSARLLLSMAVADIREGHISELQDLLLENQLRIESAEYEEDEAAGGHHYEAKLAFQVWDRHGNMVLRSVNAPLVPLSDQSQGYSDRTIDDTDWRIFSLWSHDNEFLVMAAERYEVRMELVNAITQRLLLPYLLLLPILAWMLWMAVGHGLAPLKRLAREVHSRDEHYLDNIDEANVPDEVRPIIHALNRLFGVLRDSLEKERRFTSDAAHELRTPLAALKTHAQLARSAAGKAEREHALAQLIRGVDRASHVVDQMLALARVEPGAVSAGRLAQQQDVHRLVVEEVAGLAMLAAEKNIELSVEGAGPVLLKADGLSLSMLLRNLIDNAIRYTPEQGKVDIALQQTDREVVLTVTDSGPGIPEQDRERIFQRFFRGEGLQQSGCGIGLSIVRRIAEMHHARIALQNVSAAGGLQVTVAFPKS